MTRGARTDAARRCGAPSRRPSSFAAVTGLPVKMPRARRDGGVGEAARIGERLDRAGAAVEQGARIGRGADPPRRLGGIEQLDGAPRACHCRARSVTSAKPFGADRAMQRAGALGLAGDAVPRHEVEHRPRPIAEQVQQTRSVDVAERAGSASGMTQRPALTRPTLRPEPPKPISTPSSSTTSAPPSARCSAADSP